MKFLTRQEEMVLLTVYLLKGDLTLKRIREYLIEQTGKEWSISSVYVPLDRLASDGFLDSHVGVPEAVRGGKAKKYYRINKKGISALRELRDLTETMWKKAEGVAFQE